MIPPYSPSIHEWMRQVSSALNLLLPADQTNIYEWGGDRGALVIRKDVATAPAKAGWAAIKVGILDGTEDGWLNNPGLPDNVCIWTLVNSANNRSSIWGANFSAEVLASHDATAWGIEVDMNQNGSVVTDPSAILKKVGVDCVSAGPNHSTVAYRASSAHADSTGLWVGGYYADRCRDYGFKVGRVSSDTGTQMAQAGFVDESNSAVAFLCDGGSHTWGVDLNGGTYSAAAIRTPNMAIVETSAASVPTPASGTQMLFIDTADHKLKRKDSTGTVTIIA